MSIFDFYEESKEGSQKLPDEARERLIGMLDRFSAYIHAYGKDHSQCVTGNNIFFRQKVIELYGFRANRQLFTFFPSSNTLGCMTLGTKEYEKLTFWSGYDLLLGTAKDFNKLERTWKGEIRGGAETVDMLETRLTMLKREYGEEPEPARFYFKGDETLM